MNGTLISFRVARAVSSERYADWWRNVAFAPTRQYGFRNRTGAAGFVTSKIYGVVSSVTGYSQGYPTISQREASRSLQRLSPSPPVSSDRHGAVQPVPLDLTRGGADQIHELLAPLVVDEAPQPALGRIVEIGDRDEIFENPIHPYTQALFAALPVAKSLK